MKSEEDIQQLIAEAESEIKEFRSKTNQHRQLMLDSETELIGAKIKKSQLEEELRVIQLKKIPIDPDEIELEIQAFKDKHPQLIEWISNGRRKEN